MVRGPRQGVLTSLPRQGTLTTMTVPDEVPEVIADALWKSGNLRLGARREWTDVADRYRLDARNVLMALGEAGYQLVRPVWPT